MAIIAIAGISDLDAPAAPAETGLDGRNDHFP